MNAPNADHPQSPAPGRSKWLAARIAALLILAAGVVALLVMSRNSAGTDDGKDEKTSSLGSVEVTAELADIPGEFRSDPLYNYAYVVRYKVLRVHRGKVDQPFIYVAHYNPYKPRSQAADPTIKNIGGNVKQLKIGDRHRMALQAPIDDYYIGAIINKYPAGEARMIYWPVWTNMVSK